VFDGDCGFCTASARWIKRRLPDSVAVEPWQSLELEEIGLSRDGISAAAWWIEDSGRHHRAHMAIGHAVHAVGGWWGLVGRAMVTPPISWLTTGRPPHVTVTLSEAESRRIVTRHGIAVSPFVTGSTTDQVVAAMASDPEVVYPLVAKLCGRSIAHKTERGLVRLRIADEASLRTTCDELLAAARADDGDVELLVSTMVAGNRELIVGLATDRQFGLVVMLGVGGILAEAIADVSIRLAPIEPADAAEMIGDLSSQALLGAFRGEPAVDRESLAHTLMALCAAGQAEPGLVSADINPLIIVEGVPVAVDALIEIDPSADSGERHDR